jgi:2-methylcitrate dehydratase PrpD
VTAVLLARAGAGAAATALDGPAGLFAAYGGVQREALDLGGDWEILAAYHKPVPACNYAQTPAQAALAVRSAQAFEARDVESVVVKSFPEAISYPGCDHAGPYRTQLQAKMSIQFTVAAVLVHGRLDDEVFRAFGADGEVAALARRVRLENDAELARGYPQRQGAEVIVTLRDGHKVARRLAELEPLDAAGVRGRTRAALERLLGAARAAEIEREIDALTASPDAARLARLLARD